VNRYR